VFFDTLLDWAKKKGRPSAGGSHMSGVWGQYGKNKLKDFFNAWQFSVGVWNYEIKFLH